VESHDTKVSLNTDNSVDKSHLYLEGPLALDEFFIRCYDPEQDTGSGLPEENEFYVDRDGNVNCKNIYSTTVTDLNDDIENVQDDVDGIEITLASATKDSTSNMLVKRGNTGEASFAQITVDSLVLNSEAVGPHVSLPRNSILYFIPYLADGVTPRPNSVYRFGRNHEELEASGAGDGLEFRQDNEEILIQVQSAAPTIRIGMDKDAGVNVFEVFHGVGNLVFAIHQDGSLFQAHLTETDEANIHDNEGHSSVHGGSSVFIGNMKISYVNGLPRFEYIDTIPAVMAAGPYNIVVGQLTKAASLYTVRDWLVLARNTVSDYKIRARDIFTDPTDWSPLGVDFAKSLTEDPQAFIDQASTDITTLQTGKQNSLSTSQLALVSMTTADVATGTSSNLCTAVAIKSYVDANSGGSEIVLNYSSPVGGFQDIGPTVTKVNLGNNSTTPGTYRLNLPDTDDISDGHTLSIFHNHPHSSTGPEVTIYSTGSPTKPQIRAWYGARIVNVSGSYNRSFSFSFTKEGVREYRFTYFETENYWAVGGAHTKHDYFKYFSNTESGYTPSSGNVFSLPSYYLHYRVVYGDGTQFGGGTGGINVGLGVNVALPRFPIDGCRVCLYSSVHRTTSQITEIIRLRWGTGTPFENISGNRKLSFGGNVISASTGATINIDASAAHSKNRTYIYCQPIDTWIEMVDMN
jgi:hypothetical protein